MASPILLYSPGGGVPPTYPLPAPTTEPETGVTQLVEGQNYVDVVFQNVKVAADWTLVDSIVVNTTDDEPLNIWVGTLTEKTVTGFRIYLNGMPDSSNYYLHWGVSGNDIEPTEAVTYSLSGPATSGLVVESASFTVALLPSTTVASAVTVTPDDAGGGGSPGVFTPESVTLSEDSPSATFTYTPYSYGEKTIQVTNDGDLTDPASLDFTCVATGYNLFGPDTGDVGVASTDFTVELPGGGVVIGTVTVTPSDGGDGGTFTPTSVGLTTASPSATFTYTPASGGDKTISVTNNGGLINPSNLTYTAIAVIADGDPVSTWPDSSGNGNDATQTGSARPIYKTAIVNGLPVVRFTTAGASTLNLTTPISAASPWRVFVVMKRASSGSEIKSIRGTTLLAGFQETGTSYVAANDRGNYRTGSPASVAFHVFTGIAAVGVSPSLNVDGTNVDASEGASANSEDFIIIGGGDGDIAEILVYLAAMSAGDRANIEKYLGTKYGITVAGGTAVDPTTVTGLQGWWKADEIT